MTTSNPSQFMKPSQQPAVRITALLLLVLAITLSAKPASAQSGYTGIFGGGPFYKNAANNITEIANSGFTEAIVWSVEVNSVGDLNFNGEFPLTSKGVYVGNQTHSDFAANMALLKKGTVKRITFSVGSSNFGDWQDVTALVKAQGTGPKSILYRDFAALKAAIPSLDAIDIDDENSYDAPTTVAFAVMLGKLGYKAMPDPYTNNAYWISLVSQINAQAPGTVDGIHLQAYAGGSGNDPCSGWNFGSVPVFPGLWDLNDTPAQVQTIMSGWHSTCGIQGGFMWLYDDFVGNGLAKQYASAINAAVTSNGFTLSGPSNVFLNQKAMSTTPITITDFGGFHGTVTLTLSALPKGVTGVIQGTTNARKILFTTTSTAATGFSTVTVTGVSGKLKQSLTFPLAVSAATGTTGIGTPANLSTEFTLNGVYTDGKTYVTGGLDGGGYSYSANLLKASRVLNGDLVRFGTANAPDAVACSGQTVLLPSGKFSALEILGAAVGGNQASQTITVHYSDGTSTKFAQSFSDWFTPQKFPHESEAVAMAYRNFQDGTKDQRTFNLYGYQLALNKAKTVQSVTLPTNAKIVVLGVTLLP